MWDFEAFSHIETLIKHAQNLKLIAEMKTALKLDTHPLLGVYKKYMISLIHIIANCVFFFIFVLLFTQLEGITTNKILMKQIAITLGILRQILKKVIRYNHQLFTIHYVGDMVSIN